MIKRLRFRTIHYKQFCTNSFIYHMNRTDYSSRSITKQIGFFLWLDPEQIGFFGVTGSGTNARRERARTHHDGEKKPWRTCKSECGDRERAWKSSKSPERQQAGASVSAQWQKVNEWQARKLEIPRALLWCPGGSILVIFCGSAPPKSLDQNSDQTGILVSIVVWPELMFWVTKIVLELWDAPCGDQNGCSTLSIILARGWEGARLTWLCLNGHSCPSTSHICARMIVWLNRHRC